MRLARVVVLLVIAMALAASHATAEREPSWGKVKADFLQAFHSMKPKERMQAIYDHLEGQDHPELVMLLVKAVLAGDKQPAMVVEAAVTVLGDLKSEKAVAEVIRLSDKGPLMLRVRLLEVLGKCGGEAAIARLTEVLAAKNLALRVSASSALGATKSAAVVPALAGVLGAPEWPLRVAAAAALANTGSKDAVPHLILQLGNPEDFIPLAEETGMIIEIGEWVIHSACHQGKIWHDQGFRNLNLGVNLSVRQFFDPHLVDKIKSAIATSKFDPTLLELEITETAMMHDTKKAVRIMNELKEMGLKISLDDFGTGYSSLIHLKLFHIDTLKIDQVFIRNADLKGRDGIIISAMIDMCHKLKIKAVAEGVETKESLNFLRDKNCHLAQGFYFSPPLPVNKFEDLLQCRN